MKPCRAWSPNPDGRLEAAGIRWSRCGQIGCGDHDAARVQREEETA